MSTSPRIELLTLGDEFLLGIRENSHLQYIGNELVRHGLKLAYNVVVSDDAEEIQNAFLNSWERSDIVITTGGLGAARINNTRETMARILGLGLEFVPSIEEKIVRAFQAMGRKMGKRYKRQCYKIEGAELLENNFGTAPGLWLERENKLLVMLPGMTSELRPMFQQGVISRFQDRGLLKPSNTYLQLRTIGIDETRTEEILQFVYDKYPGLGIHYCMNQGILDIRLYSDAVSFTWEALKKIGRECRECLGEDFIGYGHDSIAHGLYEQLRAMEKTVAVAESCTGGKLADAFTNVPGVSKVFAGSIVCYTNDAKIQMLDIPEDLLAQHGAVSAEVAVAMATAAAEKFSSNYGLSVTGFAGPDGGNDQNPVGTIYIGYHSPSGVWAHKVMYPGQRETIKVRAVNAALDWMRRKLNQDKVEDYMADLDMEM